MTIEFLRMFPCLLLTQPHTYPIKLMEKNELGKKKIYIFSKRLFEFLFSYSLSVSSPSHSIHRNIASDNFLYLFKTSQICKPLFFFFLPPALYSLDCIKIPFFFFFNPKESILICEK